MTAMRETLIFVSEVFREDDPIAFSVGNRSNFRQPRGSLCGSDGYRRRTQYGGLVIKAGHHEGDVGRSCRGGSVKGRGMEVPAHLLGP